MIAAREKYIDEDREGIFEWKRGKKTWLHLTVFIWVSILVHGSGFYLFKVVYPSPERVETRSGAITLLNSADPGARAVLQRVSDRIVFLSPPSSRAGVRVSLDESDVRFIPAFSNTEMELKPIPDSDVLWEKVDELSDRDGAGEEGKILNPLPARVELRLDSSLSRRGLAPWSTIEDYFAMADSFPAFRASVVVAADGKVEVREIDSGLDETEKSSLAEVIASTLRFLPAASTDQGWVEVRNPAG